MATQDGHLARPVLELSLTMLAAGRRALGEGGGDHAGQFADCCCVGSETGCGVVPGNKPAGRAASGCLLLGAAHSVASAPRPGGAVPGGPRAHLHRGPRTRPLLTWGNAAAGSLTN